MHIRTFTLCGLCNCYQAVGDVVTNGSNHWILRQPDQVSKTDTMAKGHEVLFAATSDCLPSHPTKDGRATDSCFALIGPH